jgi:hypothetical protein
VPELYEVFFETKGNYPFNLDENGDLLLGRGAGDGRIREGVC